MDYHLIFKITQLGNITTPLSTNSITPQEPHDIIICPRRIIMHIQPMPCLRLYIRLKRLRLRKSHLPLRRDRSRRTTRVETVTTTEGQVMRSRDDQDRARKTTLHGHAGGGHELAHGHGFLALLCEDEHAGIEVGGGRGRRGSGLR